MSTGLSHRIDVNDVRFTAEILWHVIRKWLVKWNEYTVKSNTPALFLMLITTRAVTGSSRPVNSSYVQPKISSFNSITNKSPIHFVTVLCHSLLWWNCLSFVRSSVWALRPAPTLCCGSSAKTTSLSHPLTGSSGCRGSNHRATDSQPSVQLPWSFSPPLQSDFRPFQPHGTPTRPPPPPPFPPPSREWLGKCHWPLC